MRTRTLIVASLAFLGALIISFAVLQSKEYICSKTILGAHVFTKVQKDLTPRYILASPYLVESFNDNAGEVDLIDMNARVVHSWQTRYQTVFAMLQPNGHLFAAMTPSQDLKAYPSGGTSGLLQELDWEGKVLWQYEDNVMTHDFEILPNGDIAYIRWEQAPNSFAQNVVGGAKAATSSVWTDGIAVVNRDKEVVWRWHTYDHLDPRDFPLGPMTPRSDWAHANSIRYTQSNPITHTPVYLVSFRHIDTVLLIDASSGDVLWRSPKGMLAMQHDATLLDDGNVLVFDNGVFRSGSAALISRVVEIDPRTNQVVWEYDGGKTGGEKTQFASSIMGGAERLPNGNTLITVSNQGKIMEITPTNQVVLNMVFGVPLADGRSPIVFKARKYDPSGTAWARYLSPDPFAAMLCR